MISSNNNSGTQWNTDKSVTIHIHKLVISGSPGNYDVEYTPSFTEKLLSFLGLGPEKGYKEFVARISILGELPEFAVKQILAKEKKK